MECDAKTMHSVNVTLISLVNNNFCTDVMSVGASTGVTLDQVEIDSNLMTVQREDMWRLLQKHAAIFSYPQKFESTKYIIKQVCEMEKDENKPSQSPYSSPIILDKKKDGSL